MRRGRLITIEGIDGAGKTTLAPALERCAARARDASQLLREPGGVAAAERIRELVKDPGSRSAAARRGAALRGRAGPAGRGGARPLLTRGPGCCSTASSTPRWPTRAPGAGWASRRSRRSTQFATGGLTPDRTLLLAIDPAPGERAPAAPAASPSTGWSARTRASSRGSQSAYRELAAAEPSGSGRSTRPRHPRRSSPLRWPRCRT